MQRDHYTHYATPIRKRCAALIDSTRATTSSMSKIHAATKNQLTVEVPGHGAPKRSPAQDGIRAVVSVSGRHGGFHIDTCYAGAVLGGREAKRCIIHANAACARIG